MLLILILIIIIYNTTGLYYIFPFVISIINFLIATFNLIGNPQNLFLRVVQLISLFIILFIIFLNLKLLLI